MVMKMSQITPEIAKLSFLEVAEQFNELSQVFFNASARWELALTASYSSTMLAWRPNS